MYKSSLNELCQQKKWPIPKYKATKHGLDHCPRFSSSVTISGVNFITEEHFMTSKEAQNEVARLAFAHFAVPLGNVPPVPPPPPSTMYKASLNELCQQKKWPMPLYNVTKLGLDHNPHFSSSVTINGVTFDAEEHFMTSKKAQNEAARLAFAHFTVPAAPATNPPVSPPASSAEKTA